MPESVGFYEPAPADRELTVDAVRTVVREQFPDLLLNTLERFGDGFENETFLVDGHVVFQFPRRIGEGDGFAHEERIHTLVASAIGDIASIPRITRWGQPSPWFAGTFGGYELIPGVPANDPSVRLNPALADDMARVLARLHAIPRDVAADIIGVADPNDVDLAAALRRVRQWAKEVPDIGDHAPDACRWLDSAPRAPDFYAGQLRLVHGDFQMEHVLVNPTTGRLSGIIDWGGVFSDPAFDFRYVLLHGGWSFFQRALAGYDLPLDADFAERTLFSARLTALGWLADGIKRGGSISPRVSIVRQVFELK